MYGLDTLLRAAREVASDERLIAPLVGSTGLSREGVTLALSRSLEVDATEDERRSLQVSARPASHVHVILAANVFTAPLRAIAVARASGGSVTVRPSRREPVFARALLEAAGDPDIVLAEGTEPGAIDQGEIHVYGRDDTVSAVRAAAREGVIVRAHGAGLGVAIVDLLGDIEAQASAVADDVILFDQRGCLSPRVVVAVGPDAGAARFSDAIAERLDELAKRVPRSRLDDAERREGARYAQTMEFAGRVHRGSASVVGTLASGSPIVIPPSGRHLHVAVARDLVDARRLLREAERLIVAVGVSTPSIATSILTSPERVRISGLGRMQRPPLDGPVDLRELAGVGETAG